MAFGKRGAFYNTLEEFHKYWERVDIIIPRTRGPAKNGVLSLLTPAVLFSFRAAGDPQSGHPVFRVFDNVFIHSSPWPLIWQPFWILKKGRQIYREYKFDLITVHEYPPFYNGIGARLLWNKIKVPYILEIFHIPGYPKAVNLKEKIYRSLFYFFIGYDCRKAKAVRVMNNQVAAKLIDLDIPESKIDLIPAIYIDLDIFKPMNLEKKYDLIFIGRLVKNKGINLFLEAVKILNCKAVIVGDGPLKESLKFKVKSLKLENNVIFYGWAKDQAEVAKFLNMSKILVMPSYNEGGPRVVIEALACGIPILATSVGIVADIIKDSQFGQLIDWDSKDIAEKVNLFLSNESEYQKYSQRGIEIASQFEKKSAIKNYAERLRS